MNKLSITEWAEKRYKTQKEDVRYYISQGVNKVIAVKMVLKESTLGVGYKIQLRHDFGLSIFD